MKTLLTGALALLAVSHTATAAQQCKHPENQLAARYHISFSDHGTQKQTQLVLWRDGKKVAHEYPATHITEQWDQVKRQVDFYDLKGDLEAMLALTADPKSFSFAAAQHPVLHPGQSARVLRNGQEIGWIGMLHPELEKKLDLGTRVYLFEIELGALSEGKLPEFQP